MRPKAGTESDHKKKLQLSDFINFSCQVSHRRSDHLAYLLFFAFCLLFPLTLKYDPETEKLNTLGEFKLPAACLSRSLWGVSCPGCGLTRSFTALVGGDLDRAIKFHRLGPFLYLLFIYHAGFHIYGLCTLDRPLSPRYLRWHQRLSWLAIAILIVNWFWNIFSAGL